VRHLDLFSGIGGFALAADWVWPGEVEHIFCEIEPFCKKVLKKHWPEAVIHNDITKLDGKQYAGTVDILTGGFPCQPVSVAGNRKGNEDARWLWPDMCRVINTVRPRWVIAENVINLINLGLDEVLDDLEASGYETTVLGIPACAVGLPHKRDRLWIVACADGFKWRSESQFADSQGGQTWHQSGGSNIIVPDAHSEGLERHVCEVLERAGKRRQDTDIAGSDWRSPAPRICGKSDGIPNVMDRLKSLGNAIVPQVAAVIMQAIKECKILKGEKQ